jgi:hypothetical protein
MKKQRKRFIRSFCVVIVLCTFFLVMYSTPVHAAPNLSLHQIHRDGSIWRYTGTPCSGWSYCPGWQLLSNNPATYDIAASNRGLVQVRTDGSIWGYTGTPCSGWSSCPGWQILGNWQSSTTVLNNTNLFVLDDITGSAWQFLNPGWKHIGNAAGQLAATDSALFKIAYDKTIWKWTGFGCTSSSSCPSWQLLDNNSSSIRVFTSNTDLFQQHSDGTIWRWTGVACSGSYCPGWQLLENGLHATVYHATDDNGKLFQRYTDGSIWEYIGPPCSGSSCPGWLRLDNNPATLFLSAGPTRADEFHNSIL